MNTAARTRQKNLAERFARVPLYAVLDSGVRPGLPATEVLDALLRAGVEVIQYRHKEFFSRQHFELCAALAQRAHEAGAVFLINDRADVAALCGADGVHVGQQDLRPDQCRKLLGPGQIVGYSTHTRDQVVEADASAADYIAIGPIFPTQTKREPDPVVGTEGVAEARKLTRKPLVAIGGISLETAPAVLGAGADAVAVVRDLFCAENIEDRARQYLERLRSLAKGKR